MVAGLVARLPPERLQVSGPAALPLDVIARDGLPCEVSLVRSEVAIQPIARTATSPLAASCASRRAGLRAWKPGCTFPQIGVRVEKLRSCRRSAFPCHWQEPIERERLGLVTRSSSRRMRVLLDRDH